ncbi:hypothetical protein F4825DRAFT_456775 [Nemania diffusa]|nr:hypothetical protein F4825DRAFT_456775 [Nemania diffusa]
MPLGLCTDDDLLAVGKWADDKAVGQLSTTQPQQKKSERHSLDTSTKPHHGGSRPHRTEDARSSQRSHHNQSSRPEDRLLERPPLDAMKEVREAQRVRRGHPACFREANKATRQLPSRQAACHGWIGSFSSMPAPIVCLISRKVWDHRTPY